MAMDHFLLFAIWAPLFITSIISSAVGAFSPAAQELLKGFTATPNPTISSFQPVLSDSTGNYSLGFLRVKKTQLALVTIHVASSETIWQANMIQLPSWSKSTHLIFNGSLVISNSGSGVIWSTDTDGDRVFMSNSSNLEIQKLGDHDNNSVVLWQSFDFPTDTLVENQNFTSNMSLISSNGLYSLKMGSDFMALYGKFQPGFNPGQMYWKHKALEAKIDIVPGGEPIYAVLKSNGFLGMYQNSSIPADIQSFNSFQQPVIGVRRVRVETDGNLKGYFWTGSSWVLDYQAISDECELPSACGPYGLCNPGKGCSCLDNKTDHNSGGCLSPVNQDSGDFCSMKNVKNYKSLELNGVELPYKELMGYQKMESFDQCQFGCEENCTCWGVIYSNTSGYCYMLEYPIQTLVKVSDGTKLGYVKVREGGGKHKLKVGVRVGLGLLCGVILGIIVVGGVGWYRHRKRKTFHLKTDRERGVGAYKDLAVASFRWIESTER